MENKEENLNFWALIIKTCFFENSISKTIGGVISVSLFLIITYKLSGAVITSGRLFSIEAVLFVFMSANSVTILQNFLLFSWLGSLDKIEMEDGEERANEIIEMCKGRNRFFRTISLYILSGALAIEYGLKSEFPTYFNILIDHPILWLLPASVILIHMTINTGNVVESLRLVNIAGRRNEIINATQNANLKIYSHQIPELLTGFVSVRMVCGYAIGICLVEYLISL